MGFSLRALWILLVVSALVTGPISGVVAGESDEKKALLERAGEYFDAEMARNTEKVWKLLAPSSKFKRSHTYEMYVEMVKRSKTRIKRYSIDAVVGIEANLDKVSMPKVEKIGIVKVHVILGGPEGKDTDHKGDMTFLKEGGRWYKG